MTEPDILIGWKQICSACGNISMQTMKRKIKKYSIPIASVDHRPMIPRSLLIKYWENFCNIDLEERLKIKRR